MNYRGSGFAININQFKILYKKRTSFLIATILISSKTMATTIIPFHELVPGSEGVRFTTVEGIPYMSVRDIIMVVCKKDSKRASETWINLSETYKNELSEFLGNFGNFQFPGRGQSPQPVITLPGALKLVMWLPGNMAKDFRTKACEILNRYIAGDASLVAEINANAVSTAPINEMARASLPDSVALLPMLKTVDVLTSELVIVRKELVLRDQELVAVRKERDHERHLRHQADGRYGSGIREATRTVRREAEFWEEVAKTERERNDTKDKQLQECHSQLQECHTALLKLVRERSRSPKRAAGDQ